MPYQVSMMGGVGSGEDFCGLGFEKVTHDQRWSAYLRKGHKCRKIVTIKQNAA